MPLGISEVHAPSAAFQRPTVHVTEHCTGLAARVVYRDCSISDPHRLRGSVHRLPRCISACQWLLARPGPRLGVPNVIGKLKVQALIQAQPTSEAEMCCIR
jgi:hypothetical protein